MDALSAAQIREYLAPDAFARKRVEGTSQTGQETLRTNDAEDSLKILNGSVKRLDTIAVNLNSMVELAGEGRSARTSEGRREEIYALMRSLSAGIDTVVDETRFNGQRTLNGSEWDLSGDGSNALRDLDGGDFAASGDLGIARKVEATRSEVFYTNVQQMLNSSAGVIGLDINGIDATTATPGTPGLEAGDYELRLHYAGPDSSAELVDASGKVLSQVKGIDLSGEGKATVAFPEGLEVEIGMESLLQTVDKYDYENKGPATLRATVRYEQIYQHHLDDGQETPEAKAAKAGFLAQPLPLEQGGGQLGFGAITFPEDGKTPEAGSYRIDVDFRGAHSLAELRDSNGTLLETLSVDLSEPGAHALAFDTFSVEVENTGIPADATGQIFGSFRYTPASSPVEDFDFDQFLRTAESALARVDTQREELASASERLQSDFQTRQSASSGLNSMLTGLLGGNSGSILSSLQAGGQTGLAGMQMLQSANSALFSQGDISSNGLSSLLTSAQQGPPAASLFG